MGIYMCESVAYLQAALSQMCYNCEFKEGFPALFTDADLAGVLAETCGADGDSCYFENQTCLRLTSPLAPGMAKYQCFDMEYFDTYEAYMA